MKFLCLDCGTQDERLRKRGGVAEAVGPATTVPGIRTAGQAPTRTDVDLAPARSSP